MSKHRSAPKLERMYAHILESSLDRGKTLKVAKRIAAATVNKHRAKRAKTGGPKLVGKGGSRRQWYPGKKGPERLYCYTHKRRFKSLAGLKSHYRSHRRRK